MPYLSGKKCGHGINFSRAVIISMDLGMEYVYISQHVHNQPWRKLSGLNTIRRYYIQEIVSQLLATGGKRDKNKNPLNSI